MEKNLGFTDDDDDDKIMQELEKDGLDFLLKDLSKKKKKKKKEITKSVKFQNEEEVIPIPKQISQKKPIFIEIESTQKSKIYGDNFSTQNQQDQDIQTNITKSKKFVKDELYEEVLKLTRRAFNKLTNANLQLISQEILRLYQENPKNYVNRSLSSLILSQIGINSALLSHFIAIYAALIAILHSQMGTQVSSFILEKIVRKFDKKWKEQEKKTAKNLVLLIANSYIFGIMDCKLIYDIIRNLIEKFSPIDIELLLALIRSCGPNLRGEDPTALKEIVLSIQQKVIEKKNEEKDNKKDDNENDSENDSEDESIFSHRVDFMLDTIYDLKNKQNKFNYAEQAEIKLLQSTIKSTISSLETKNQNFSKYDQPMGIPYKDFMESKTNGRWWITGTAWKNESNQNPNSDSNSNIKNSDIKNSDLNPNIKNSETTLNGKDLELLMKNQRMNTDIRRAIFTVVVTSEDYLDSFEKLVKLGLKGKQEREIVRVIIECCAQEKGYNPYYAYLSSKLCEYDHNFKQTFQFSFWDQFKQLDELEIRRVINSAKLLANLILMNSLSLVILKVVDFSQLKEKGIVFFKLLFILILSSSDLKSIMVAFQRVSSVPQLINLKQSLFIFLESEIKHEHELVSILFPEKEKLNEIRILIKKRIKLLQKTLLILV
ncbi:nucleolar mif4g domain-containing protein [Anaeramoeba ignava]|uniref:Nucleolar mif4g domain-containing protein n=1 Tax=Anaeramoeba ignava TaxID=1746090 RepID=A0A9Q0LAU8_ANAIG|nr:nucleolar mif4g domain-containing protein [Anaeramoeba ignava]